MGPALSTGTGPFAGTFSPKEPLSYFNTNAVNADGEWTLKLCDLITGDTGTLNAWNITFGTTPTCLPPSLPSISNVNYNSATLAWSNGSDETAWEIEAVNLTNREVADQAVDFTDTTNPITLGTNTQTTAGMPTNILGMWAGNVNNDLVVQYSGTNPDTPSILSEVLNHFGNFLNFPTFTISAYNVHDINLDGNVQYSGTNPDTPLILQNILAHPGNFLNFSTYQITEQLPEN